MKHVYLIFNDATRNASVRMLHVGHLAEVLESSGFQCIGDLLKPSSDSPDGLLWICGLSLEDSDRLSDRIQLLRRHVDRTGNVDWGAYHAHCAEIATDAVLSQAVMPGSSPAHLGLPVADDAPLVPLIEIGNGRDFIGAFPEVIDAIVRARDHAVDRAVLTDRLSRQPGERMTLDQIASSVPVRVTRERVRQRETKMLRLLANALIHGRQRALGVKFRACFTAYWRIAAEQFGDETEITFARFIEVLADTWNVPPVQLFAHIPFITAVLTSSATIPAALRAQIKRDPRVYRELDSADSEIRVTRLALGGAVNSLLASGISTLGDLFDAARNGHTPDPRTRAGRVVENVLAALVEALTAEGRIDWSVYESGMHLIRVPATDPPSITAFLATLTTDLEAMIRHDDYSVRATEIFRLRIAVARSQRPTLAQVADLLGSHGSSIKREESVLLSRLNDHLVERDMTRSAVSMSERYLSYWSDASDIFSRSEGSFENFLSLAMSRWDVSHRQLSGSGEVLWAVLSEYPAGRLRRARYTARPVLEPAIDRSAPLGKVVLRGFRRPH